MKFFSRLVWRGRDRTCPACRGRLDAATAVGPHQHPPTPGDFSLCAYCGAWLVFTARGLRLATQTELDTELNPAERHEAEYLFGAKRGARH